MPGTKTTPDGEVKHFTLNAIGYSEARRLLDVGDWLWGQRIIEKLVDDVDAEVMMIVEDGTIYELRLP